MKGEIALASGRADEQGRRAEAAGIFRQGIQFDREQFHTAAAHQNHRLLAQLLLIDRRSAEAPEQCRTILAENGFIPRILVYSWAHGQCTVTR